MGLDVQVFEAKVKLYASMHSVVVLTLAATDDPHRVLTTETALQNLVEIS